MNAPEDARTGSHAPAVAAALADYQAELDAGHTPDRVAFLHRHAAIAGALDGYLRAIEFVHGAVRGPVPSRAALGPGAVVGDFRIVREVGRGGMGVVYEAVQESLGRRVALKVLPPAAADERALQRFRHEALAASSLQHPHIVPVFAVGHDAGVHYFAMQFVEGQSLAAVVTTLRGHDPAAPTAADTTGGSPVPPPAPPVPAQLAAAVHSPDYYREVARLVAQAADALGHAHEVGVVHRDIKPGNLLLDANGDIWVADFGLAKLPGSDLTGTADVMGTVRYMSPEQASGRAVALDHRTDVYSLGVTLYELLTLSPAFTADDRRALLRKVLEEEPVPPRKRVRAVPADLDTVALKAMAKEPAERYQTAGELADDLRRFLDDRPIVAKPPTPAVRARKWARRNRVLVGATGSVTLAALVATVSILKASNAEIDAKRRQAEDALGRESLALAAETEAKGLIAGHLTAEQQARARERRMAYLHTIALVHREWQAGNGARAAQLLDACHAEYRRWEWHYLHRLVHPDWGHVSPRTRSGDTRAFGFAPNGDVIVVEGDNWWQVSPGGDGASGPSRPLAFRTGARTIFSPTGGVGVTFSGASLVTGRAKNMIMAFDLASGKPLHDFGGYDRSTTCLAFSPDGRRVVSGSTDKLVRVWAADTGILLATMTGHDQGVSGVAFCPDRNEVVSVGRDGIRLWAADTGRAIRTIRGNSTQDFSGSVVECHGRAVAVGNATGTVKVWDADTGQLRVSIPAHEKGVAAVRFSPDGRWLATAAHFDKVVRLWYATTGKLATTFCGHESRPNRLQFDPSGRFLLTGNGQAGDVRVWDLTTRPEGRALVVPREYRAPLGASSRARTLAFAHSGSQLAVIRPKALTLWDSDTGRIVGPAEVTLTSALGAAFTPDDRAVTVLGTQGGLEWTPGTDAPRATFSFRAVIDRGVAGEPFPPPRTAAGLRRALDTTYPGEVSFTGDGDRFVAIDSTSAVRLYQAAGTVVRTFATPSASPTYYVSVSRQGTRVVTVGVGGLVIGWDAATGQRLWESRPFDKLVVAAMALDPTGRHLVVALKDGTVALLGADDGVRVRTLQGTGAAVLSATFSPDGERVVCGLGDADDPFVGVKVWDTDSGTEMFAVPLPSPVVAVAFRPDGRSLAALGMSDQVWMLDGPTPAAVAAEARQVRWAGWHDAQATEAEAGKQWRAALWHLDRMLAAKPGDVALLARRAVAAARSGRFADLAPDEAATAVDAIRTDDMSLLYSLAARLLEAGDGDAYRRLCQRVRATLTPKTQILRAGLVYRLCTLGPGGVPDLRALARECEERMKPSNPFSQHYVSGTIHYRAGDYAAALRELTEGEKHELASSSHATAWLFLAMTCHKLDAKDDAKAWLAKADEWYAENVVARPTSERTIEFQVTTAFPILRKEAAAQLRVK